MPTEPGRHFVRGAVLSGASVLFSMAALLAVGKMVTNAPGLTQAEVGVFMALLLTADFCNILNNFGLWVALPKLVAAADAATKPRLVSMTLGCQGAVSLLLAIALLVPWRLFPGLRGISANPGWQALYPCLWLVPALFIAGTFRDNAMAILAGFGHYGARALGIVVSATLQVGLVFGVIWWLGWGLVPLALCMAAAYGTAFFALYALLPGGHRPALDWRRYRESVRFSLPLYANSLLNFFFQRFDGFLVGAILGIDKLAIYEIAKRFPTVLSRTLGTLQVPFLPGFTELVAKGRRETAVDLLNQALMLSTFLGYLGVFAVVLLQEPLILLIASPQYLEAAAVVGVLMCAICFAVQAGLLGLALIALDRPIRVTQTNFAMACIAVVLNLVLLPRLGLLGGGISLFVAASFSAALQTFWVRRHGLRIDLLTYGKMQVIMLVVGLLVVLGGTWPWRLTGLVLFVGLSFSFNVLHPRTLLDLARMLRPAR